MASLDQALQTVSSAILSSYTIKSFTVKWQSIRNKLEELYSGLSTAGRNGDCGEISPLTKLIHAISATASDAEFLAELCSDDAYRGGKLLMNSNLDVIAAKLQLHARKVDDFYASGILINCRAIVLSKPGSGASREDMRLYVKELFSRLRIGELDMRDRALTALNEVLQEGEKYVRIVASETADAASIFVNLLEFRDMTIKEQALQAVSVISGFSSYRGMLVLAGIIPALIQVLDLGSKLAKERAAQVLLQMTENGNNAWLVSSQGGVTVLLKICGNDGSTCKLISLACGVLRNISGVCEIKRFMVDEGVVAVLLKLLKSKEEVTQIQAMEFLYKMASEDEIIKDNVVRKEIVESLLTIMNPDTLYSSKVREATLRIIEGICFTSSAAVQYLLNSGFLCQIIFFLRNREGMDQELALKAVSRFCRVSEEVKRAMGDMGFISEIIRLLEDRSFEARETAAETLCSLVSVQKNRRRFIQEEENVDRVLQLFDPKEGNIAMKILLLSALMTVTDSNSGRRKVAVSAYVTNLEKLAETNMDAAKKIMKKLSGNRFRSMLNLFWAS